MQYEQYSHHFETSKRLPTHSASLTQVPLLIATFRWIESWDVIVSFTSSSWILKHKTDQWLIAVQGTAHCTVTFAKCNDCSCHFKVYHTSNMCFVCYRNPESENTLCVAFLCSPNVNQSHQRITLCVLELSRWINSVKSGANSRVKVVHVFQTPTPFPSPWLCYES
jgi:hypothetical protein